MKEASWQILSFSNFSKYVRNVLFMLHIVESCIDYMVIFRNFYEMNLNAEKNYRITGIQKNVGLLDDFKNVIKKEFSPDEKYVVD